MKAFKFLAAAVLALLLVSGNAWAAKPRVKFDHKRMNIHMNMSMKTFTTFERLMPADMRREIGEDYYPFIRRNLTPGKPLSHKEARINMNTEPEGRMTVSLEFPNYFLVFSNVTWEEMDKLFKKYFKDK